MVPMSALCAADTPEQESQLGCDACWVVNELAGCIHEGLLALLMRGIT